MQAAQAVKEISPVVAKMTEVQKEITEIGIKVERLFGRLEGVLSNHTPPPVEGLGVDGVRATECDVIERLFGQKDALAKIARQLDAILNRLQL